jgi:uncharacterized membrane-anchored protein/membrane-associated phospholipid phosphatase
MESFNYSLFRLINAPENASHDWMLLTTFLAEYLIALVPIILVIGWLFGNKHIRLAMLRATASGLLGLLLAQLISALWQHPRPFMVGVGHTYLAYVADASFPSDHATLMWSVALSLMLSPRTRQAGTVLALAGLATAWARIWLGVHFPLDMVGALGVSLLASQICKHGSDWLIQPVYRVAIRLHRSIFATLARVAESTKPQQKQAMSALSLGDQNLTINNNQQPRTFMNVPSTMIPTPPIRQLLNKVPEVTLAFWVVKIMSTTVGETAADFLAVNAGWGQGLSRGVMAGLLAVALFLQLKTLRYTPWIYWLTVVLVSVVGTQITDLLTDKLGVSLYVSTPLFAAVLAIIFAVWYRVERSLSIHEIHTRRRELFYWAAILCTFALGTAAGDLATEALGLGFKLGAVVFGIAIAATYAAWRAGGNAVLTFWVGYILTRPFGAALGDLLTQATTYGGLGLGAMWTSALFLSVIVILVAIAQTISNSASR